MSLFAEVDKLKEELDALRPLSAEQEARVLQKFRLDWNYNSNAIEGNSLTLGETRSLLLHGLTAAGKPMRDHLDIRGHNDAVVWLEEVVRNEQPLTGHFIREMHEVLLGEPYEVRAQTPDGQPMAKMIYPGRYKSSPNNVLTATGEMFYFTSPEETPAKMTDLVDWYNKEAEYPTLHPVALAAEFHYRFVRIHPFDDGNGRMSRLLMNLILMRSGYPMTVIKASDRNRYLAALAEADAGEIEPFFSFISENVTASLLLMTRAANGESIDEPDDLDKKLALLKTQVLNREDAIKFIWNTETQANFYEAIFKFWLDDFTQQMIRFSSFFIGEDITIAFKKKSKFNKKYDEDYEYANGLVSGAHDFINTKLNGSNGLAYEILIRISWTGFRTLDNSFNQGISIKFYFHTQKFEVKSAIYEWGDNSKNAVIEESIFSSLYRTYYDKVIVHETNYQLANKAYEFIAAKVAEANTRLQ